MTLPVGLTDRADRELDAASIWWAKHRSEDQAARWFNAIVAAMDDLGNNPEQWPLARENSHAVYDLRERSFGLGSKATHRILFTVRPDLVLIVSVRHAAQDDFDPNEG